MKIPYTSLRNGNRFYEPRGRMVAAGFEKRPLGPDGEWARKEAWRLYEQWMAVRDGRASAPIAAAATTKDQVSAAKIYPRGSIGAAWQEWVRTEEWSKLALTNRNKVWWPAWTRRIEPVFGDVNPNTVTVNGSRPVPGRQGNRLKVRWRSE